MARERKFSTVDLFEATKQILFCKGFEGFSFSLLAERMEVSRGAIYKYYENKEELVEDFMLYEMNKFFVDLKDIELKEGFDAKFDLLLDIVFKHHRIHQILGMLHQNHISSSETITAKKEKLDKQHKEMYQYMKSIIDLGKAEGKIKSHFPDDLTIGLVFRSISIPNYSGISHSEWVKSIKEVISHGIFT